MLIMREIMMGGAMLNTLVQAIEMWRINTGKASLTNPTFKRVHLTNWKISYRLYIQKYS